MGSKQHSGGGYILYLHIQSPLYLIRAEKDHMQAVAGVKS